jgi:hypothetical protein
MEEYRKKYLEEENDESAEDSENNESEGEGGSEEGAGDGGEGGEGIKSSGGVEKRKLRTGKKGSVVGGRRRTRNKEAVAARTGGRGRSSNRCRVM